MAKKRILPNHYMLSLLPILLFSLFLASCGGGETVADATNGAAPISVVDVATTVTENGATLNGFVVPNGLETTAWFEYGLDNTLSSHSSTSSQPIGSSLDNIAVTASVGGLADNTTYYFRICSSNARGTTKSSITSLTTSYAGAPPAVVTAAATAVGATAATLNGNATPNGLATTAWFEWGTGSTLSSYSSTSSQAIGAGLSSVGVDDALPGLSTGTTYYYRIAASNGLGTSRGSISSFVPGAAPAVTTLAATSVGATAATLNGNATPNGLATTAWFEWGTGSTLSSYSSTSSQAIGSGTSSVGVNDALPGLSAGTTYYYRIAASNGQGTSRGSILSFVPGAAPTVSTAAATSVGATAATLNGSATPNGLATTAWFEYGTSSTLSTYTSTSSQDIGSGTSIQAVSKAISGLASGVRYYFRVVAQNDSGTQRGSILNFTTPSPGAPVPTTQGTAAIPAGAIVFGNVNPAGLETTAWFEWGTDPVLSSYTASPSLSIGSGTAVRYLSEPLAGLSIGTTYYYRVVGQNSQGTSRGTILSFTAATGDWAFYDDFSTDITNTYSVAKGLGTETFTYDSGARTAVAETGDGGTLIINHMLPGGGLYTGTFSMKFTPTAEYGGVGTLRILIADTPTTFYELSTGDAWIRKSRAGVIVDSVPFPHTYSQGSAYTIKITVSQYVATVEAFGGKAILDLNHSANPVNYFSIRLMDQDAIFDDIKVALSP